MQFSLRAYRHRAQACARREVRGRARLEDPEPGATIAIQEDRVTTMPMTVVPEGWFSGEAAWRLLLARKFRYHHHINKGELRTVVFALE